MIHQIFRTAALPLAVLASAVSAQADVPERVLSQLKEIDPHVELRGSDIIWMAEAEQICAALSSGLGLTPANPDDPRELRYEAELEAALRFGRPASYPPCDWYVLEQTASEEDFRILTEFYDPEIERARLPTMPQFVSGEASPEILGLRVDAEVPEIAQRFTQLQRIQSAAQLEAQQLFHSRISALRLEAAEARNAALSRLLQHARRLGCYTENGELIEPVTEHCREVRDSQSQ